jgi:hypothetical protein
MSTVSLLVPALKGGVASANGSTDELSLIVVELGNLAFGIN